MTSYYAVSAWVQMPTGMQVASFVVPAPDGNTAAGYASALAALMEQVENYFHYRAEVVRLDITFAEALRPVETTKEPR